MFPIPTTPSTLPRSSLPRNFFFSHLPASVETVAAGIMRARPSMRAKVCSATETALPPGVFITSTPAAVAAARSTLSTPTPARPITRSFGALASVSAFTFTALRTSSASQSARCGSYSFGLETTTSQPACDRSSSIAAGDMGSATKTFNLNSSVTYAVGGFSAASAYTFCTAATPLPNSTGTPFE